MGVFGGGGEEGVSAPNAKGFGVASIRIFSQKSKKRVYPKLTEGNFGKLLRFLAVLEEQKIVSEQTKSQAYIPQG